ncbi:MAG: glycosyltransferase family 2 protein, partial [Sedimentibacter sp.]
DDVWLPDKIDITYKKMKEAELENNNLPILIHTDLKVVDENLNLIADSLMEMQNLDSSRDKINSLLVQNIVTGCTVMINRNLLNYIKEKPEKVIMHDWWLALVASALGKIVFIDTPTVLYRQHDDNDVGAKNVNSSNYILNRLGNIKLIRKSLLDTYIQSGELLTVIGDYADKSNYDIINQYSSLLNLNKLKKIRILKKYGFWKNSFVRILGQILFC